MKVSKNFSLSEFTRSQTATRLGIENVPTNAHLRNIEELAKNILQPVRDEFGPTRITSGYRSQALNNRIGGSKYSQHSRGEAADFEVPGVSNLEVAEWIRDNLVFDQLILEGFTGEDNSGWIHCSYTTIKENRKEVLTAKFVGGKAQYSLGLSYA